MLKSLLKSRLKSFTAAGVFVALSSSLSTLAEASECRTLESKQNVEVTQCSVSNSQELIKIYFTRNGPDYSVSAIFDSNTPKSPATKTRFWSRLWASPENESLSQHEVRVLREILSNPSPALQTSDAKGLIDVLSNMIGANQKLKTFDRSIAMPTFLSDLRFQDDSWTMICEFVGQEKLATFTVASESLTHVARVGDPSSKCRGRCGLGCWEFMQERRNQYTQQCFDHDICHNIAGAILGECEDEFWLAAVGYMYAPNCE